MKIFKYKWALFIVMLLFAASCQKDKLNPVSSTGLSDASAFSTPDRILNQVKGLYSSLKSGYLYGSRYLIYGDIRGENFINQTNNAVTGLIVWNFTVTGGDQYLNDTWEAGYSTINQVNVFLDGLASKGSNVINADLVKQYTAEAKFVRALTYYSLLQLFAPPYIKSNGADKALPLRLTGITGSGSNNLARSTVAEVYAQIIKDLDEAETNLPTDYGNDADNVTRANQNTAIALETRVYLSEGDWADVIKEANKIVPAAAPYIAPTGVPNQLVSDIASIFTTYTTKESIFSMPFTGVSEAPGGQSQLGEYYLPGVDGGVGEYSLNPSGVIADANWKATDSRRAFLKTTTDGKVWLEKYKQGSPYLDWAPVLRYSEVLLNLAEAKVRSTNALDAQAIALLNAVRQRSDPSTTFTAANFSSAADLETAILQERNIEFLGEGLRGPDITRLGLSFPVRAGLQSPVGINDPGYTWPAPSSETNYNSLW